MTFSGSKVIESPADLEDLREKLRKQLKPSAKSVRVCIGTGCAAKGSRRLYELFLQAAEESGAGCGGDLP